MRAVVTIRHRLTGIYLLQRAIRTRGKRDAHRCPCMKFNGIAPPNLRRFAKS